MNALTSHFSRLGIVPHRREAVENKPTDRTETRVATDHLTLSKHTGSSEESNQHLRKAEALSRKLAAMNRLEGCKAALLVAFPFAITPAIMVSGLGGLALAGALTSATIGGIASIFAVDQTDPYSPAQSEVRHEIEWHLAEARK